MEAVVLDAVAAVLGRVGGHVPLGRVEHVGDPDVLEVGHVLDRLPVPDDDAVVDLHGGARIF